MEDYSDLRVIREIIDYGREKLFVKDEEKELEFLETRKLIEEFANDIGASVEIEDSKLFPGGKGVTFMCDEFCFDRKDLSKLLKILEAAINYEIYPRTDGKLVIGCAFTGFAKRRTGEEKI